MLDYIISHPLYIPFLIFNIYIIYKVIKYVMDQDKNDHDENGGNLEDDDPKLELPPGVTIPVSDKETV